MRVITEPMRQTQVIRDTDVVIVGGGHFGRFFPYSSLTSIVCLPLECFDCNWHCKYLTPYCTKAIAPEVIIKAVQLNLENQSLKINK